MPVQFNIDSRHDENARFKKVLFGYDGQLLEVEVNELQDIFNARMGRFVDEVFGSRPLYVGNYTIATNTLTITNELVSINKELIFIPSIALAVTNGDTIYLNLQEKTIAKTDVIKKYGALTGSEVVTNYLQDSRLGEETTKRVQVTYQLTKTNIGTGTFLKLCTITAGVAVKNTADYADSDLYKEIRRLASEVIAAPGGINTALVNHKASTTDHAVVTTGANGFMSAGDKVKLDGIATGAEVNQNSFANVAVSGQTTVAADAKSDTLTLAAGNGMTITTDATTDTVTIAAPNATTSVAGSLSAADKTKLDGIATGAEVNQNSFGTVTVAGTALVADSKTDTLTINAGNAVTLTPDAATDTFTIASPNATQSVAGAMSAADKTKLDGVATGAEVNQNSFANVTAGGVTLVADAKSDTLAFTAGNAISLTGDAATDTVTIASPNATQSVAGALSAADKTKLDGIATGAEVNQNSFATIVAGGVSVVADSKSDTLTLTAGANIAITGDASTDTVTIAATGIETPAGAQTKADQAEADAIAWAKSFGLGDVAKDISSTDLNSLDASGLYKGSTLTNCPTGIADASNFFFVIHLKHSTTTKLQIAVRGFSNISDLSIRQNNNGTWQGWKQIATTDAVTQTVNGLMIAADKAKLDGIAASANNYVHPANHPPSIITQDASNRFVTDTEKSTWNAKASTAAVTTGANGLMIAADKTKLDGIATGAEVNQNSFATIVAGGVNVVADSKSDTLTIAATAPITVTGDATNDKVTIDVNDATTSASGVVQLYDANDSTSTTLAATANAAKKAYDRAASYANSFGLGTAAVLKYVDLNTIVETGFYRTDRANASTLNAPPRVTGDHSFIYIINIFHDGLWQIQLAWDYNNVTGWKRAKVNNVWGAWVQNDAVATSSVDGFMSAADKSKLDGVAASANNYVHPANHPPSIITQDASNRFTTDAEKATWNAKASTAVVTTGANGLMIAADKSKLDGIAAGAQTNQNAFTTVVANGVNVVADSATDTLTIAATAPVTVIGDAATDTVTIGINGASQSSGGIMSPADKTKLDGIAVGAQTNQNAFTTVTAGGVNVVADSATDTLTIAATAPITVTGDATNDKVTIDITNATAGADGAMSAADKSKLDGIAAGATNYVHPANHPPSIITQDASNRFTTDAEKATWNAKASTAAVTTGANGLMIAADKSKLDGIAAGANNYTHPATHPPSIIAQDASNRFTTDAEKAAWNGKMNRAGDTMSGNLIVGTAGQGFMFLAPDQPGYRVDAGTGTAVMPVGSNYKLPFNSAGSPIINGVFTVPTDGKYQINVNAYHNVSAGFAVQLSILVNGATKYVLDRYHNSGSVTADNVLHGNILYRLTAGDTVQFNVLVTGGTASTITFDNTVFSAVLVA